MKKTQTKDYHKLLLEQLKDMEFAAEYLNAALEENDETAFLTALKNVVEAQGMSKIARKAHLNRENMYRMLSENGNPRFSNLMSLVNSLGLSISIRPAC
jgi:probable addiction module antidote protein